MQESSQLRIKELLLDWREDMAQQLGLGPQHAQHCARNSMILHDIYVDAISEQAPHIHSLSDLHRVAYYWKHIDSYGPDLFRVMRDHLDRPKRCMAPDDGDDYNELGAAPYKRMRTHY